jgi:YggT family protein
MVLGIIVFVLEAYLVILLLRAVLSWFPLNPDGFGATVQRGLYAVTEPVLAPLRSVLPPMRMGGMGLDLSPMIVMFAIIILLGIIH